MSHDSSASCACVNEHRPPVLEFELHHVWPLGDGGPDVPGNRVWVCPTTHTNAHEILRLLKKAGRMTYREVQASQERPVSRYAYTLACLGYIRIQRGSL